MVAGFRRALSLPLAKPAAAPALRRGGRDNRQSLRSTSLPGRSHPVVSHLLDQIRSAPVDRGASPSGIDAIDRLLAAVYDLLRLPQTGEALRRRPAWADRLLDAFLRLADAHGSFRSAVLTLSDLRAEAQAAIRRADPARLASIARSFRRTEKEAARLAAGIKDLARSSPLAPGKWADAAEAEIAGILTDAAAVTAAKSVTVFLGIASAAAAEATSMSKDSWKIWPTRKASKAEETVALAEGLEEGIGRVFRSSVNIRVSLLNAITPAL
ncbi:uncharacterized protein LOC121987123 [Zingiber officinale]|uniref:Uncharacterized protein n=1 Tax=Zingiber officinale TaxID=94328 RepID=A0A8J5GCB9_ZINOF|nr:uncharacterized protein LOC121987123 [Zingiber officinale]KAG6505680.1 hypothetical protein ZIOFF_038045 [Zingiber officinale]